jgi:hypothetical protein
MPVLQHWLITTKVKVGEPNFCSALTLFGSREVFGAHDKCCEICTALAGLTIFFVNDGLQ